MNTLAIIIIIILSVCSVLWILAEDDKFPGFIILGIALFGLFCFHCGRIDVQKEAVINKVATYKQQILKDGSVSADFVWLVEKK